MDLNPLAREHVVEALEVRRVPSHGHESGKPVCGVLRRAESAQEQVWRVAPERLEVALPHPLDGIPQNEDEARRGYPRADRLSRGGQLEVAHARLSHGNLVTN